MKTIHLKSIDSTHLYALRLLDSDTSSDFNMLDISNYKEGIAIFADQQTGGIGRSNRAWVSDKGNLFTSIITGMPSNKDLGQLSLTVACAIRETIAQVILSRIELNHKFETLDVKNNFLKKLKLHWPNDVYYNFSKISGALLAVLNSYLVISVGININSSPKLSDRSTTSIKEILDDILTNNLPRQSLPDLELHIKPVLDILLHNVFSWMSCLCNLGFSEIRSYWLRNISKINCRVIVRNGNSVLEGFLSDINDSGKAVLLQGNEELQISSGDLFLDQGNITSYRCS